MVDGSTGKCSQLRSARSRSWYMPQSTRMRVESSASRNREPVTLRAAPRKVMVGALGMSGGSVFAHLRF
jgi:hypothetical protein